MRPLQLTKLPVDWRACRHRSRPYLPPAGQTGQAAIGAPKRDNPGDARSKDSRPSTWRLSFCVFADRRESALFLVRLSGLCQRFLLLCDASFAFEPFLISCLLARFRSFFVYPPVAS